MIKAKRKELEQACPELHSGYTLSATTELAFDEAVSRVREVLAREGLLGVLLLGLGIERYGSRSTPSLP